jgi:uncharacterized protein (DUF2147 family)
MDLILMLFIFFSAPPVHTSDGDQIIGSWYTQSGNSRIQIYQCDGHQYCGRVEWLQKPERDGHKKTDARNPDESLRSRPIIGLQIMHGFKYNGSGKWEDGKIYNPQNGKTYSARIKLKDGKLEMRGYLGISMLGKTEVWTKAE